MKNTIILSIILFFTMVSSGWWMDHKLKTSSMIKKEKFESVLTTIYSDNNVNDEYFRSVKFKPREYIRIKGPF